MNKKHPIDELFKERLGQSSADVPTDMWDRIATERGQVNRKPKLLWLWTSLGVLVVLGGLLATQWFVEPNSQINNQNTDLPDQNIAQLESNSSSIPLEQGSLGSTKTKETSSSLLNKNDNDYSTGTTVVPSHAVASSKTKYNSATRSNRNEQNLLTTNKVQPTTNRVSLNNDQANKPGLIESDESTLESSSETEVSISGPHQRRNQSIVNTIPNLSFGLSATNEVKLFEKSTTSCARFNNPFFHLDLEMLLGPAYAQQQLATRASESSNHLKERENSESADLSYSIGLRLAATTKAGLGLRTGLIYSQINEVFEHEAGSEMNINILYGSNGEIISMDTTFEGSYTEQHKNQLKFLEVPLLLGYETKVGKFRIGVNAGAYLQLAFDAKGQIFSPATGEPIAFGQVGDRNVLPIFNQRTSAAWYAGASITYNLHSRYSIMAEPYFKTFPRAISAPDYDLTQNYWTVGMQLGIRMRL